LETSGRVRGGSGAKRLARGGSAAWARRALAAWTRPGGGQRGEGERATRPWPVEPARHREGGRGALAATG
jgi:hypothetical protein